MACRFRQTHFPKLSVRNGAGKTVVLVGRDQKILGAVTLADQLRAEARQAVNDLKAQDYCVILLTGDSSDTARAIGRELGVDEAIGDLLPEQKVEKIRELLRDGPQSGNGRRWRERCARTG